MKTKILTKAVIWTATALLAVAGAAPVTAVPPLPATFHGVVINAATGAPAPAGLGVVVRLGTMGLVAGTTTFAFGNQTVYRLDVPGDDLSTPAKEGVAPGEAMTIVLDGRMEMPATWQSGTSVQLDLRWTPPEEQEPGGFQLPAPPPPVTPPPPPASPPVAISIAGGSGNVVIDDKGTIMNDATVESKDGKVKLTVNKGTKAIGKDGVSVDGITGNIVEKEKAPIAPEGKVLVGQVMDLGPDGATFDPPLVLSMSYAGEPLPAGTDEDGLALAFFNGTEWEVVGGKVDPSAKTVIASIGHFTGFAMIAPERPVPPPPVPTPTPAPAEPVSTPEPPPTVAPPPVATPAPPPTPAALPTLPSTPPPASPAPPAPPVPTPSAETAPAVPPPLPTTLTQVAAAPGINWAVVGGLIGAVAIALAALAIRRRPARKG